MKKIIAYIIAGMCLSACQNIHSQTTNYHEGGKRSYHNYAVEYAWSNRVIVVGTGRHEGYSCGSFYISEYEADNHGDPATLLHGSMFSREGSITKSWCEDLNRDGTPEIIIWVESVGSGGYDTLHVFTVDHRKRSGQIQYCRTKGMGLFSGNGDPSRKSAVFEVKEGILRCRYPVYAEDGDRFSKQIGWELSHLDTSKWQWVSDGIQRRIESETTAIP